MMYNSCKGYDLRQYRYIRIYRYTLPTAVRVLCITIVYRLYSFSVVYVILYTVKRGGDDKVAIDLTAECVTAIAAAFYAQHPIVIVVIVSSNCI